MELTSHRFNLADPLDHAAFLSLVQHHGYPTPVLDWTQSPFVAAYFSFKDLSKINLGADEKVRIFIFDSKTWANTFERAGMLMPGFSHVTILEPLATNNPRALPQQSLSSVTNVDDLEQHIRKVEEITATSFLTAIDLPASDRRTVMQDLALMGITAGSLFPGIDGACLQLKERFSTFDHGGILVRVTTNSRAALPSLRQHQSVGWVESFTRPNNPERCDVLGLAIGSTQPTHYKRYMALLPQAGAHPVSRDAESPGEMQDFRHLAARVMHCPPALTSPAPPRSAAISART